MSEAYAYPTHVHAASFVSIKLSGNTNYREWQEQMMCLVDSHDMVGFIDGTLKESQETSEKAKYREWKRSDTLVKGWIFGSLSEGVMVNVVGLDTANAVWDKLKATYSTPPATTTTTTIEMEETYPYPSHVNVANFISIMLEGVSNYSEWEEQMICLLKSYDMLGVIDGTLEEVKHSEQKRSDTIVKGWIFGTLSEDVMTTVVGLDTANEVWDKLNYTYSSNPTFPESIELGYTTRYLPLYRAIMMGDWEEAREIMNDDEDALTVKLNPEGYSALHIAVEEYENFQFVESLLKEINPEFLPTLLTHFEYNALHCAAQIGNTKAAKMLVEKNPNLLFIVDKDKCLPIGRALANSHINTFEYLLNACIQHIGLSQQDGYHSPFEGENGAMLLTDLIDEGLVDVACELIKKYPDMARITHGDYYIPLMSIATNEDLYYSGTRYNFYQAFVYAHVPTEINNLDDTNNIQDIENQDNCNCKFVTNGRRSYFYHVLHKIYVKLWNVALLYVPHAKHLQEEKVKHKRALTLLKCICEEIGKIDGDIDLREHYLKAFHLAVMNDTHEAVEVIMKSFPQAIWTTNEGYFATQIAIRARCFKVHNALLRHLGRNKYLLHTLHDNEGNRLLHLAGKLAPIDKLNLVSGAALQMQRELQWYKGVENFEGPPDRESQNRKGETPIMVFRREHEELRKEGESWMKKTADSYTITAALIITIVFAAAISVPGGNAKTGEANYATKPGFFIFIVSDAMSLFSAITALLLFLSILTARYQEEDFLYRLPLRLILGLAMLFLSVTSMMVAFSATLYLTFGQGRTWILIPVATFACLPVASFVTLQLPLLVELINSTYYHGIFSKHSYHMI